MLHLDANPYLPKAPSSTRPRILSTSIPTLALLCTTLLIFFHPPDLQTLASTHFSTTAVPKPLTALTLTFNNTKDARFIAHNCALLSQTRHRFLIYTDTPSAPYCTTCTCRQFTPVHCSCPDPTRSDCALCEKLQFIHARLREQGEFVFLDSDALVLHEDFLDRVAVRAQGFDFLASYGFARPCDTKFKRPFNSGVFFMRWVDGVDYGQLMRLPWELMTNNDQNVLSAFVHREYRQWDVLGMQWHCRFLNEREVSIPAERCFVVHGRGPRVKQMLQELNRTLLQSG